MPARTGRQRSGLLRSAAEAWTLALLMIVYGLWAALALVFPDLPLWLSCPLLVLITVQFMSIQHEIVHGHPTRSGWLNEALVSLPLGLGQGWEVVPDAVSLVPLAGHAAGHVGVFLHDA
ncbi:MAG: hypothetical protein ACPGSK_06585, partial [Alphaproteobacteria bacterium]